MNIWIIQDNNISAQVDTNIYYCWPKQKKDSVDIDEVFSCSATSFSRLLQLIPFKFKYIDWAKWDNDNYWDNYLRMKISSCFHYSVIMLDLKSTSRGRMFDGSPLVSVEVTSYLRFSLQTIWNHILTFVLIFYTTQTLGLPSLIELGKVSRKKVAVL